MNYHLKLVVFILCVISLQWTNSQSEKEQPQKKSIWNDEDVFSQLDGPIQLVKPDTTHKKLVLVEENVKLIQRISGAVATVAVVGKFHSGKSFLMNQLMGNSNGFGVGPTVRPQTMGIWMWGKPLIVQKSSGKSIAVIFLDTEGFAANNISESYDSKIFAVATLLSSYLIYNSVKIIDQSDIDYLEVLARRTQLFALRSQLSKSKWTEAFNHDLLSFPPLIWVVQDFVQATEGLAPTEWLRQLMSSHSRENEDYEINLLGIFNEIDCHTLFLPATKKNLLIDLSKAKEEDLTEDYRNERDDLKEKLFGKIVPKEKNDRPITGPELAALMDILVTAANEGSLSEVPTRWNAFILHLQVTATEDCFRFYEAELDVLQQKHDSEPVVPATLEESHLGAFNKAVHLLAHLLFGLEDAIKKSRKELNGLIRQKYEKLRDLNEKKIKLKCSEVQARIQMSLEESLTDLILPLATTELLETARRKMKEAIQLFDSNVRHLLTDETLARLTVVLENSLRNIADSTVLKNNRAIEDYLREAITMAEVVFRNLTNNPENYPRVPQQLNNVLKNAILEASSTFEGASVQFKNENQHSLHFALLRENLRKGSEDIHKANELLVKTLATDKVKDLLNTLEDRTTSLYLQLPMPQPDLEAILVMESKRVLGTYQEKMADFKVYNIYASTETVLEQGIQRLIQKRQSENMAAFTKEVSGPLGIAKKVIKLTDEKYQTTFSLKRYMVSVCLLNLDEGKAKSWSTELKAQIVEHFIENDSELQQTLLKRKGWWSSLLGFFQWVMWCLWLSE